MTESSPRPRRRAPGAGRPAKQAAEKKVRLHVFLAPDLAAFVARQAGSGRGAESRFIEALVRDAEIRSRLL